MSEAETADLTSGDVQGLTLSRGLKSGGLRRVGAIDIGTNSTHLLVASVDPALGTFSIIQAEKSTTRLGERDPETGELSAAAMERGFKTLRRFLDLANSHQVEQVVTAATSAVREAPMGAISFRASRMSWGLKWIWSVGPRKLD
jgi:exopolyphosphatase/guanosine-5'-triphosphate,3'-diphosphate pyrophosphatase